MPVNNLVDALVWTHVDDSGDDKNSMNNYRLKGASGKVAGHSHSFSQRTTLGSGKDCDLVIDDSTVAAKQAEIVLLDSGNLHLVHLDPATQTLVNGQPVTEILLNSGDEIRLRACRWVLQAPGLRPEKVLTEQAVKQRSRFLPWLIAGALGVATAIAVALAWQRGLLPF